ncbi:unnamed protein product, partial [Rotaria socialis]
RFSWPSFPRIDHFNEDYAKYKQRDKNLRREKSFVQVFPQDYTSRNQEARIDHHNPDFEEFRKRKKSAKLPPIEDRKFVWSKKPRVNQRNDAYIERIRQKRSTPMIFREKLKWGTKAPKIDARNDGYVESLKDQPKRKVSLKNDEHISANIPIVNNLPRWTAQPKIDAHNDSYDPNFFPSRSIVNEKLQWYARPKIDTGLEPDSADEDGDDEEYYDDDEVAV